MYSIYKDIVYVVLENRRFTVLQQFPSQHRFASSVIALLHSLNSWEKAPCKDVQKRGFASYSSVRWTSTVGKESCIQAPSPLEDCQSIAGHSDDDTYNSTSFL